MSEVDAIDGEETGLLGDFTDTSIKLAITGCIGNLKLKQDCPWVWPHSGSFDINKSVWTYVEYKFWFRWKGIAPQRV